jgi:MEMO1 family protein
VDGQVVRTRRPAVAGRFYPRDPHTLAATVDRLLDAVDTPDAEPLAAAYVVPHAGYAFSGPTAAHAYARLRRHAGQVRQVVLIGPSHFVPVVGCAAPASRIWTTPLGDLPVAEAHTLPADDTPHAPEHSLEVQLPFLQRALGRPVPILPVVVGQAAPEQVAAHLAALATPGTVVLCSTDLSHYLDHAAATDRDARTAAAITALEPDRIGPRDACGAHALRGLLAWGRQASLRAETLDLRTSAETAGEPSRVVGYGAFALHAALVPGQRSPG